MVRDLRKYAQQTTVRLGIGAFLLFILVGDGLIWWIYGSGAAIMGLVCLMGGMLPIILIVIFLWGMDWVLKRANRD